MLLDDPVRRRAMQDLATSFLVDAGAGTGKTSLLVGRILTILESGAAPLAKIAAITFTEKAAGELKVRIREEVERRRAGGELGEEVRDRLQKALEDFERAHVTTIHAFCATLLREHAVEAGVDPAFDVLDALGAQLLRAEVWRDWLAAEMVEPAAALRTALECGVELRHIEQSAFAWLEQRDLADGLPLPWPAAAEDFERLLDQQLERLEGELSACTDPSDKGYQSVINLRHQRDRMQGRAGERRLGFLLNELEVTAGGRRGNWRPPEVLARVKESLRGLRAAHEELCATLGHNVTCALFAWLRGFLDAYEAAKRARGVLDFTDLLLRARDLVRRNRSVRSRLQRRWRFFLVDEFQDTDPLQVEIVFFLAEALPRAEQWREVQLAPGKLFLVGDPKQSIYRFRRADLDIYHEARSLLAAQGELLALQTNFRSAGPLVEWVNERFAAPLAPPAGERERTPYVPLVAGPDSAPAAGRSIVRLPITTEAGAGLCELRAREARAVAELIRRIAGSDEWRVRGQSGPRPPRFGDVGILFRRNEPMQFYEEALRAADVPYRVAGGRRFYRRQELIDLLSLLTAITDPDDAVALLATLRGPFCGMSDEDLLRFRRSGGSFSYMSEVPAGVHAGADFRAFFAWLRELHRRSERTSAAVLLREILAGSHFLALLAIEPQGDQRVANVLKAVELARELEASGVRTVRGLVELLRHLRRVAAEDEEFPAAEPGDDAVWLTTIHKAKGLEYPVVILADGAQGFEERAGGILVDRAGGALAVRVPGCGQRLRSANWKALWVRECEQIRAEEIRLLYVAATRARDYLVLPEYPAEAKGSLMALLAAGGAHESVIEPGLLETGPRPLRAFAGVDVAALLQPAGAEEGAAIARASVEPARAGLRRGTPILSASLLRAGSGGGPARESGRGREGLRLGTVVHHALRRLDPRRPETVAPLVRRLGSAAGLAPSLCDEAVALVQGALALPCLRRAFAAPQLYREMPFAFAQGSSLIEGAIDLVFRDAEGVVVVDYKTDLFRGAAEIDRRAAQYRAQAVIYACAVERASGWRVEEVCFAFLAAGEQRSLRADWQSEAAALIAAAERREASAAVT